ncbi:hypothetical protein ABPG72_019715 [Tetrahymena utriculariae]
MDPKFEIQLRAQEQDLQDQNFFNLDISDQQKIKDGMVKVIASAYIRFKMAFRACCWKGYSDNDIYIQQNFLKGFVEHQSKVKRIKQKIQSFIQSEMSIEPHQFVVQILKHRDQVYSGGIFQHVNSYVQINESIKDEKTKYLYRDVENIGLKKSDQVNHQESQQAKQLKESQKKILQSISSTYITKYTELLLKCIIKDIQYYYGYNFRVLKIFQVEFAKNSDFRIPHIWWSAFQDRYRMLIEFKRSDHENKKKFKLNVFKYNYFLCPICIQYNCMIHKSCNDSNYLKNDNWTPLFDKNIPKHQLHNDKIKDFLTMYNGTNYAHKFVCKDHEFCFRNPLNKNKQDLISVQQHKFNCLNKRWINMLLYFADCFTFQNPCFLSIIINMSTSSEALKFQCKDIYQYLKSVRPQYYSLQRIQNEINAFIQSREKEYLKLLSKDSEDILDDKYIQKYFYHIPEQKQELLNQLKELSEMLKYNYTPCFHTGVCDGENGCRCYRNRDLIEKMQKRIDKLKHIQKKEKKHTKKVLELSFDNNSIDSNDEDNEDESSDLQYMAYQEIISKFLHECERFCGCPNYCRSKNKQNPINIKLKILKFVLRKLGCNCLNDMTCQTDKNCQCRSKLRECDPEVCRCFCNRNARTIQKFGLNIDYCTNSQALYNCKPRVLLGKSLVCEGLGLFAGQDFKKNQYIGCYIGEIINEKQGTERQEVQQPQGISYLFMLNKETDVDSFRYGNKMRYVNHNCGSMANCKVDVIYNRGINIVRFSAKEDIQKGQEIYFDYNRNYQIEWMKYFNEYYDNFEQEEKKQQVQKKIISKYIKS